MHRPRLLTTSDGARDRLAVHHDFVGCQVLVPEVSRNPTQKPADGESNVSAKNADHPNLPLSPLRTSSNTHLMARRRFESRVLRIRHPEDVVDC